MAIVFFFQSIHVKFPGRFHQAETVGIVITLVEIVPMIGHAVRIDGQHFAGYMIGICKGLQVWALVEVVRLLISYVKSYGAENIPVGEMDGGVLLMQGSNFFHWTC